MIKETASFIETVLGKRLWVHENLNVILSNCTRSIGRYLTVTMGFEWFILPYLCRRSSLRHQCEDEDMD